MRRLAEISLFLPVAAGLHVAAFGLAGSTSGLGGSSGAGGENLVTLAAVPPQLAALVETWERAPDADVTPASLSQVMAEDAGPDLPAGEDGTTQSMPRMSAPPATEQLPVRPTAPARPATQALTEVAALALPAGAGDNAPATPGATDDAPDLVPAVRPLIGPAADRLPDVDVSPPASAAAPANPVRQRPDRAKPARPDPPSPPLVAEGRGGKAASGDASASADPGRQRVLAASWGAKVQARIARAHRIPKQAQRLRLSGRAVVRITLARDGRLVAAQLLQGSGVPLLDQAAMQSVRRAGRFPAAPAGFARAQMNFDVPLSFRVD